MTHDRKTVIEHVAALAKERNVVGAAELYETIDEAVREMINANVVVETPQAEVGKLIQLCLIGLSASVGVFFATHIVDDQQMSFLQSYIKSFADGLSATALPMIEALNEQEKANERGETETTGRLH